ncbi:unnamed protein product [marine sediment metagenome]|uniref:Uncharacterized protein n=1 Tax=marine sediment metagenome TaxID=412755 RepID=X1TCD4_9ZZZZ
MEPQIKVKGVQWLESEDPTFEAGEARTAIAEMTNPTAKAFDYVGELYLDVTKAASSGSIAFSLAAGETRAVSFPVTMPGVEGIFPVFLDVFVEAEQVGAFRATEDVTVVISPSIIIGPITWE